MEKLKILIKKNGDKAQLPSPNSSPVLDCIRHLLTLIDKYSVCNAAG